MVNKCSAFGCRSGYKTKEQEIQTEATKVTFHAYPLNNQELLQKWIKANPRKDFVPSKNSKICSLHFHTDDFITERTDSNAARKKRKSVISEQPLRRHLKEGAVPSIFPNAPGYLSTSKLQPRSSKATASCRLEQHSQRLQELEESFLSEDIVTGLSAVELEAKLKCQTTVPSGFMTSVMESNLVIFMLQMDNDVAKVAGSITVNSNLNVTVSLSGTVVDGDQYKDIVTGGVLTGMSELVNLMARVKSWVTENESRPWILNLQMAVRQLKDSMRNFSDAESDERKKLGFIIEQLQLMTRNKFGRSYSPEMTIFAYMVHATSPAAYSLLQESKALSLPSLTTLKKVTKRVDSHTGLDNTAYLKLRVSKLNEFQRTVVLMIDEIYVAKRVEFSGGDVTGLTGDGSVASTLLRFMVKSVAGKYKDIVGIYPMNKLTAEKQNNCYLEVMELLRSVSLNVVAVCTDNAATNRKFFIDFLCGGELKTSVIDKTTGQPIFLLFDPVHTLKNVYNNLQSRKVFECPPMPINLPEGCVARFSDIVELT